MTHLVLTASLLIILAFPASVFSANWQDSFYTDDSPYYLKLFPTGFKQRFRIDKSYCHQIEDAELLLKSSENQQHTKFIKINSNDLKRWPSLYGINNDRHCWYEVQINNIDLNQPSNNQYLIKIIIRNSSNPYYYTGLKNSILPKNRLTQNPYDLPWIDLGQQGATPVIGGGVFFKIWEPTTDQVHLFLNQNSQPVKLIPTSQEKIPLLNHVIYLPAAKLGDRYFYKFIKKDKYEKLPVGNFNHQSEVKIDPMARRIEYDDKGGLYNTYVNPRAIISSIPQYKFYHDNNIHNISSDQFKEWIIYQVWPLTFNPKMINGKYKQGTFNDILEKLNYIDSLGINAIEFLPINETRFHASWGYALDSLLLIEKHYGSHGDFQKLVDQLHQKKIRVILDIVINHINNNLIRDPLSKTVSKTKYYNGNTDWGPRPNFQNIMVKKWIADSLVSLIRDYHIDGFRFDMTKYIYDNVPDGYQFLQELNILFKLVHPRFYSTAEELPDNVWSTFTLNQEGLAFDSQWNDLFKNFFEKDLDHYRPNNLHVDLGRLFGALLGYSNHRSDRYNTFLFGPPRRTINYLGSHDFIGNRNPILRIVSDYDVQETVGQNTFFKVRPSRSDPQEFQLIHNYFTHSVGRMAYGILFTKPGGNLFFQGEELANDLNVENEWSYVDALDNNSFPSKNVNVHHYISAHRMPWEFLKINKEKTFEYLSNEEKNSFIGYHNFFKAMINLKKSFPNVNNRDAYNVRLSYDNSIISYQIGTWPDEFFVIVNFGDTKNGAWISFPGDLEDWWCEFLNSSSHIYGGNSNKFQNIISNVGGRTNHVRLAASSIIIFKKNDGPAIKHKLYLRGSFNNWQATENFLLTQESDHIYSVDFVSPSREVHQFKLATKDWEIELGSTSTIDTTLETISGHMSYLPDTPNIRLKLKKGRYKFLFNIKTFHYTFNYLEDF